MKIKIYIINLLSTQEKQISDQLKNCPVDYEFITAIVVQEKYFSFNEYNQNTINHYRQDLKKPTEIGAFLSHIKAIKAGKKDNVDLAIILEDDVVLSPHLTI